MNYDHEISQNEASLLISKRFAPIFVTQFLGAFNDNLYKTALIMLIAFGKESTRFDPNTLVNICAGLFILPYFLFSAFAGQLADKYEKSALITITKLGELMLALLAVLGFYFHHLGLLLVSLFLLGTQATFFGPLKYSILPQHLKDHELLAGNGFIEMGTFIAILLGTIFGGALTSIENVGIFWVSVLMVVIALLGVISSLFIPKAQSFSPELKIDWHIFRQTGIIIKETYRKPSIFYAIIGISWFWLFGSIILTQTANFARLVLGGDEQVATLILTSFSVGIGLGSVSSSTLSHQKIELGFVFLGLALLTIFAFDFSFSAIYYFQLYQYQHQILLHQHQTLDAFEFLKHFQSWRILLDGMWMGVFGGIYLVPLYTFIQKFSIKSERSRMIAANNILNAIFMVVASLLAIVLLHAHFSIPELFAFTAMLNIFVGIYLWKGMKLNSY